MGIVRAIVCLSVLVVATALGGCWSGPVCVLSADHATGVEDRLNALHAAASEANLEAYFACFDDDAVFLGTDASERWTTQEFKAYCTPYFAAGKGWTYTPRDRHVRLDDPRSPRMAWFDELLDNEKYGTCRGSGVLVRSGSPAEWKIVQYNLAFMVPNETAAEVTAITKGSR